MEAVLLTLVDNIIDLWGYFLGCAYDLLAMKPEEWSAEAWSLTQQIHGPDGAFSADSQPAGLGLKWFAISIMLILWAISFFRHVDGLHRIDMREMLTWILRLAIVWTVIEASFGLMDTILRICLDVNASIVNETAQARNILAEGGTDDLRHQLEAASAAGANQNIFELIGSFFSSLIDVVALLLVWVIVFACGLVIVITVMLRFFKLYIYAAIAPIPLATFAGSETQEIGTHFLKNWFAVCLEVCIIAIALGVFTVSMSDPFPAVGSISDMFSTMIEWGVWVSIKIVLLAVVVKGSDQISQKIVGAG